MPRRTDKSKTRSDADGSCETSPEVHASPLNYEITERLIALTRQPRRAWKGAMIPKGGAIGINSLPERHRTRSPTGKAVCVILDH
jgi:hypothetical protein